MIFQFSREARSWELVADSGELLGTATVIPNDCWEARMTLIGGGQSAWATDLDRIKEWMIEQASVAR